MPISLNLKKLPCWYYPSAILLFPVSLQYAEMEMRHRFVNHARNVWDRAVSLLPRIDQLWYKYIHMEEMCRETAKARLVFDRWMAFEPDHAAWMAYIKVGAGSKVCAIYCLSDICQAACCDLLQILQF